MHSSFLTAILLSMLHRNPNFIFLHINKTAGVSIATSLTGSSKSAVHRSALFYKNRYPKESKEFFKFTVVRNPWAKEISDYYFHLSRPSSHVRKQNLNFEQYIDSYFTPSYRFFLPAEETVTQESENWYWRRHQLDWISVNGKIWVDYILRFENLKNDFKSLCGKLNIPKRSLIHTHKTAYTGKRKQNRKAYTELYTDRSRKLVEQFYRKDIEYFGFTFGGQE